VVVKLTLPGIVPVADADNRPVVTKSDFPASAIVAFVASVVPAESEAEPLAVTFATEARVLVVFSDTVPA
jgi:hypothetical protein